MVKPIQPRQINNQTLAELHYKKACKYATTAALTATPSSGNQILTNSGAQATFSPDGTNVVFGDRILIKDQSDTTQNGIYKVTNIGSGSTNWVLERADHFNSPTECVSGSVYFTIVSGGTTNKHKSFFIGVGAEEAETTFGTTTFSVSASGAASEITVADEPSDPTCFPVFTTDATGNRGPKTNASRLTFNSNTGELTATSFAGALTGNVTGNTSGSSGSCTGNAATATLASTVTVTDSTADTEFPVVFNDESNALLDDTGSLTYNPSNGNLTVGNDLILKSDTSSIFFGDHDDVTLTHDHNIGLILKNTNSAETHPVRFQIKSEENNITANNVIASYEFAAGDLSGGDSVGVCAAISAIAESEFTASANETTLAFTVAESEAAHSGTTHKMKLSSAGVLSVVGDIIGLTSDKRLKTNVEIIESPLDKINRLSGFTYHWSKEKCETAGFKPSDEKQVGVFAQDVQAVLPEAVKPAPFDTNNGESKSGENYLTVQYEKIVPLLIESIKEQQKQIEELRNEVDSLKK